MKLMRTQLLTVCCLAGLLSGAACAGDTRKTADQPAPADAAANNAGAATQDLGKLDAEIAGLEAQAAKNPDDPALRESLADAFVRRARVHLGARRLNEALADYQNALSHKPDHEEAQERITLINQELEPEPVGDDGRPVTVPARPGAGNSNQ